MENDSDSDDSGILVEEVTTAPSDDEGVLVEEVAVSHAEDDYVIADATVANEDASDDDAVVIEDVTHERDSSDSSSDDEEDEDDDLPVVEEVAHPKQSSAKQRAPPSRVELAQAKEEKRVEGNALFAKKRFRDAAKFYGEAIDLDPYDHSLYSNRALCFLELGAFEKARLDAEECTKLRPDFLKGHLRLARALRLLGACDKALEACRAGLEVERNSKSLRAEYVEAKRALRAQKRKRAIQGDLHDLAAEMTPEERRWKAWWAGQGHPTCVNNTNLERYIPDCPVDVSYDAEVSQELHGPDNLPRLEEEDDEDEDDLLLEEILERLKWDALLPKFEDEGLGPRSLLTCARLPELRPVLQTFLQDDMKELVALAEAQASDCLEASWDRGSEAIRAFPPSNAPGLAYTYPGFSWRQRVREIELRVLLPPGCSARDLCVEVKPRRITVKVKKTGLRVWPYERNSWTSIVDVGPQLPGVVSEPPSFDEHEDDVLDALDEVADEPKLTSAAEAFRKAKARPVVDDDHASDDELEVEELPMSDDELEVEELPLSDDDDIEVEELPPIAEAPPRTLKARWVEGGLALKEFEVSEQDVRAQIFAQTAIPPELQILESDGVVVADASNVDTIDVREAASTAEAARLLQPVQEEEEAEEDDDNAYADAAPDTVTLLDFPTSRKLLVDESVWHVSKPPALKGHALQAPILVMQLAKFQNLEKGTAQDAAQAWWRTMFLGAGEDDSLKAPPAGFFKWK
uniref:CS domain-containing protein n=1 Tax=Pelagomonas calceolata TaxID=35677 RepID=A0A7S4E7R8_9STRA